MKIYIAYNTINEPYGGANQFLNNLKKEFEKRGVNASRPDDADAIIFNSHNVGGKKGNGPAIITRLKYQFPKAIFIHRVDGPVSVYRNDSKYKFVDNVIYALNSTIADGTVYQSEWSRQANLDLGKRPTKFQKTILNAPDPAIFYPAATTKDFANRKIKIIASSFSSHPNKGFPVYEWLDKNLDFSRYEMTFVGNTPTEFDNIKHIAAVAPQQLAELLREHDIYLTASQKDPCSNALIEALHCGLPAVALRDGGHPEIVGRSGELFSVKEEIPELLEHIAKNYNQYGSHNHLPEATDIALQYQSLVAEIMEAVLKREYQSKKLSWINYQLRHSYYYVSRFLRILRNKIFKKTID